MDLTRTNYSSGAPLEEKLGYSRMVKVGPFVRIGGTTSVQPDGSVYGEGDMYKQAKYIFDKFVDLLAKAGATPADVIGIRMFVTETANSEGASKAFREVFGAYRPTLIKLVITALNRPAQLIECECEAVIDNAL
ncbi:MAG: Rid family hydrolase [Lawsonibacter sp.]